MSDVARDPIVTASLQQRKPWRVLVVDPDADTRFLYKIALEPLGVAVAEAEDGAEALGRASAICRP
jgi:CheY-like chemotaxis protein